MKNFDEGETFIIDGTPIVIQEISDKTVTYTRCESVVTHSIELFVELVS